MFPLLEIIHIAGFAVALSTIFMVDLRLIGIRLKKQLASQLARDFAPWTLGGFAAVPISVPLIWTSGPNMYLNNPGFSSRWQRSWSRSFISTRFTSMVARRDPLGPAAALVAVVSIAPWISVIAGRIFIAFV